MSTERLDSFGFSTHVKEQREANLALLEAGMAGQKLIPPGARYGVEPVRPDPGPSTHLEAARTMRMVAHAVSQMTPAERDRAVTTSVSIEDERAYFSQVRRVVEAAVALDHGPASRPKRHDFSEVHERRQRAESARIERLARRRHAMGLPSAG